MTKNGDKWRNFHGPNLAYIEELHERFLEDPNSVDQSMRAFFTNKKENKWTSNTDNIAITNIHNVSHTIANTMRLLQSIRTYGHQEASLYPITKQKEQHQSNFELRYFNLTEEELKSVPATMLWENAPHNIENGLQAYEYLKKCYTGKVAYEFSHVFEQEERDWLDQAVEKGTYIVSLSPENKHKLLDTLLKVDAFEQFLQKTFVGQKRFSIEGVDMLVPMLEDAAKLAAKNGYKQVVMGMAHRGRLNVLAHVLQKPYDLILSEFHHSPNKDLIPSEGSRGINFGWTGDVKYHLGANHEMEEGLTLTLAHNPSHLEFVNPVVSGFARAYQDERTSVGYPIQHMSNAMSVVIHGDAAFPGEGVVAETLNLMNLRGYNTGGTIHIIANNLLGFTTDSEDARSTKYASDIAKGFEIPIIHVNADDPEACLSAIKLAFAYKQKFQKDVVIDLIGYRRYGHNEMDDPMATQPLLYEQIAKHDRLADIYSSILMKEKIVTKDSIKDKKEKLEQHLKDTYKQIPKEKQEVKLPESIEKRIATKNTAVSKDVLMKINTNLLTWPKGYTPYPKLEKILQRRNDAFEDGKKIDWALAETLAFATILKDGTPIRLTGQDSERGTFAQRHLVLHDHKTNRTFSPLHHLPEAKASFAIYNSPLSEAAALGFEYGYSVKAPDTLVLWEAQYGDFVNAAQVIIDQFISAGQAKWGQKSKLVMLLPHGFEGQGPEHSSARLERFLTLAAESNWTIANLTSAAQYFHILRRQAALEEKEARPLIILTPKSLLRNAYTACQGNELSDGSFHSVLEDNRTKSEQPEKLKKLIFCSGKIAIDLITKIDEAQTKEFNEVHIIRIEELYPFPEKEMRQLFTKYKNVSSIAWVQEEPKNMGAWPYIQARLKECINKDIPISYIGRPDRSSPATGDPNVHKKEQDQIIDSALDVSKGEEYIERN
ncbi:2-oxoglutarate dehydrogenase E1 component [Bacillus sp. HMF5848]|uniref:2-oxoglutarate dehydrogenase E1 component n=1 Tax=Bacillus sp. HMF5848 TaxID=2495421 RepID=UPI0021AD6A19|nr:2-oxoglutarate dehydrogenase E1 component [Bacillus sp. HMF5848]